jgi:hypothetical protein
VPAQPTIPQRLVAELDRRGGTIISENGQGISRDLAEAVGADPGIVSQNLARLERSGAITRDVRGKRTFRVSLAVPPVAAKSKPKSTPKPRSRKAAPAPRKAAAAPARRASRPKSGQTAPAAPAPAVGEPPVEDPVAPVLAEMQARLGRVEDAVTRIEAASATLAAKLTALEQSPSEAPARSGVFRRRR